MKCASCDPPSTAGSIDACWCTVRPLLVLAFLLTGLFPSNAGTPWQRLRVYPSTIQLHATDEHGLVVIAEDSTGQQEDVTSKVALSVLETNVLRLVAGGLIKGLSDGEGRIEVRYQGLSEQVRVVTKDMASQRQPSFRQDILPLLTKAGCNAGGCHGKLAGQNGFRLSLRGFAPEWDHPWITTEVYGRRLNYAVPEESLMVMKALGRVPHEGGQRFPEGSREHRLLVDWIAARAPGPVSTEADAARLEVLPGQRQMTLGQTQRLLVRAHYAEGVARDVTWLCQFFSNDETTLEVTTDGVVRPLRPGETSVRVHFQDQVEIALVTTPYPYAVDATAFTARNNLVDDAVFAKLHSLRIPPAPLCDDGTFVRRVTLDLIGTLPSPAEVRQFVADARPDKRSRWVETLFGRAEFVDYWTLQLADQLQNRRERDHDVRGSKGVRAFHAWLREQVAANRPWNELARDVLTATGDSTTHPEIGYYITTVGEKSKAEESEVADSVAQAFLGARIGCAKCHNHPLERYTQDDYYRFAAFFSKVSLQRESPEKGPSVLAVATKDEEQKKKEIADLEKKVAAAEKVAVEPEGDKAEKKLAEATKRLEDAERQLVSLQKKQPGAFQPRTREFLAPQPLDRSKVVFVPGQDLRASLADWITDPANAQFSGAMVNRLWKHFFSVALVEQVDDIRASNPPSNPALWESLCREFQEHRYDMKHVMRLMVNSRSYQLSSQTRRENKNDHRFFSHYYARRLPAEVMLDAISSATGVPDQFPGYPEGLRAIHLPEPGVGSYFLSLFGRSDRVTACACERSGEVTLPQLLHLANGDELIRKIRAAEGRLAKLLSSPETEDAAVIAELFHASLGRPPREKEDAAVRETLAADSNREEVFRDLFWALLNTKEFAFNH